MATMVGRKDETLQAIPDSIQKVRFVHSEWIESIRAHYCGRVIRRTVESRRYDGKIINDSLPPYKMIIVKLVLTEREMAVIRKVLDGFSSG